MLAIPATREGLNSRDFLALSDTKEKLKFLVKLASFAPSAHT